MKLSQEQKDFFYENGYLIVEDVITDEEIAPVRAEYAAILDREAPKLVAAGKLSQTYEHLPFEERYTKILGEMDDMYTLYQHFDISLPLMANIPADTQMHTGPATFHNVLRHENILDIAESLLGPEVFSNPTQHTRIKPPSAQLPQGVALDSSVGRTFWHQDEAVLTDDAMDITMLTVWVAMTDAMVENGCMICVPGSHKTDGTLHCPVAKASASEIYIPDSLIDEDSVTPMPVKKGGVVLLHQRTQHAALENVSDQIRWSFDLRFNKTGQATGREWFPGFVARSAADPSSELRDAQVWADSWYAARDELVKQDDLGFNSRWEQFKGHALCA